MERFFIKDLRKGTEVLGEFMILKNLFKEIGYIGVILGDKTGDIKAKLKYTGVDLNVGDVIRVKGISLDNLLQIDEYTKVERFDLYEFLPSINRPIEDIIKEMTDLSNEEFKDIQVKTLNDYFFKDKDFVDKFKKGIGGVSQHHNYLGGLAEHTLNSMYIAKNLSYRYNLAHKEIAILGAKLHDIGKVYEYYTDGPFSVTTQGDMEGHIVIGTGLLEKAFQKTDIYSEEFKMRIKSCIIQHHGKVEFGSPKVPKTEEAYVVHFADYVDAMMNKIQQVRKNTQLPGWSEFDRRLGTRLYL